MLAVSIKRRVKGSKAITSSKWNNNEDKVTPRKVSIYDKGMNKKQLTKDVFRLAFKLDKTTPTDTEIICEKNRDNQYYHAHLLIRPRHDTGVTQEIVDALKQHIEASSCVTEYRWSERLKRDIKYYKSIDGLSGEIFYTEVFNEKEWLYYLGKTEPIGDKTIFISKK